MLSKRVFLTVIIATLILTMSFPYSSFAKAKGSEKSEEINTNLVNNREILVKLVDGKNFTASKLGVTSVPTSTILEKYHYRVVRVPDKYDFNRKLSEIRDAPNVALAEPDYIRQNTFTPSDPGFDEQWYLDRMQMPEAWKIEQGSTDITIAVLDTGVSEHPDLRDRVLPGYDFVNGDNDPTDDNGHGTSVAGVIAANTNHIGVVGIDLNAKILPVKVSDSSGKLSTQNIVEGIYYAIDHGAEVINMSYGSSSSSKVEENAIRAAYKAGIVLVAAAGNDSNNIDAYPASYPPVISVAATGQNDSSTEFSNSGYFIDIAAPGDQIYSTLNTGGYAIYKGTSYSAPIVSGIAALLKASHPNWKNSQIEWALEKGAESPNQDEWNQSNGYGRVNAYKSLMLKLPAWESDAPDEQNLAKSLAFNKVFQQKANYPMDDDWFHFNVEESSTVTINITNKSETLDLVGVLKNSNGILKKINEGPSGENEQYTFEAEQGEYFLNVYDFFNHWSESEYEIEIISEKVVIDKVFKTDYSDVNRYIKEISFLTNQEIIRGFQDGTFKPGKNVTRLQAVQMILKQKGIDVAATQAPSPGFKDVTPDSYGYKAIAKAVELGFIKGKSDGTFNPGGSLSRWQMAAILVKAYDLQGTYDSEFTDVPANHWAHDVINTLAANDITAGYSDSTFKPTESVSREHFSVFLFNYINLE